MIGPEKFDYILVGGGLQAALTASALHHHRPTAKVLLIERNERLCGNHTWSFHEGDIRADATAWVRPLPFKRWPGYAVNFPQFKRYLNLPYCSLSSHDLETSIQKIAQRSNLCIRTCSLVTRIGPNSVQLDDGNCFAAPAVLDCRGMTQHQLTSDCGFQSFHGFEIELKSNNWPDRLPILMDVDLPQHDGFRFVYVLPLTSRRVLIEQTAFSEKRWLDRESCLSDLRLYLAERSITDWKIVREERGCLPMPYGKHIRPEISAPLRGGFGGGWFHAATGYSFPLAARFADVVASSAPGEVQQRLNRLAAENEFQAKFSRFLNRMLFRLVAPEKRWKIFRRFYRVLPENTIQRFYAHEFTRRDAARILIGLPPQGLTPVRFLNSFKAPPCPAMQN